MEFPDLGLDVQLALVLVEVDIQLLQVHVEKKLVSPRQLGHAPNCLRLLGELLRAASGIIAPRVFACLRPIVRADFREKLLLDVRDDLCSEFWLRRQRDVEDFGLQIKVIDLRLQVAFAHQHIDLRNAQRELELSPFLLQGAYLIILLKGKRVDLVCREFVVDGLEELLCNLLLRIVLAVKLADEHAQLLQRKLAQ